MRIRRDLIDEIVAHSREARPRDEQGEECCGLIGGSDGEMTSVHRARNAAATWLRYEVHPSDQIRIMDRIEADGEELVGIYHSHTKSPAYPSQTDVNLAGQLARRPLADLLARGLRRTGRPRASGSATRRSRRRISTSSERPSSVAAAGRPRRAIGGERFCETLRDAAERRRADADDGPVDERTERARKIQPRLARGETGPGRPSASTSPRPS